MAMGEWLVYIKGQVFSLACELICHMALTDIT